MDSSSEENVDTDENTKEENITILIQNLRQKCYELGVHLFDDTKTFKIMVDYL
jgi:hypothetical protein